MGKTDYLLDSNVIIGFLKNEIPPVGASLVDAIVDAGAKMSAINRCLLPIPHQPCYT